MLQMRGRGERRGRAREAAMVDPALRADLPSALVSAGWAVHPWSDGARAPSGFGLAVAGGSGGTLDAAIAAAGAWRRIGAACVAILFGSASAEQVERAAAVTPFVYDLGTPIPSLVRLLAQAAEVAGRACRRASASAALPAYRIELGISVERDHEPLPLGVAERNFLYLLAAEAGATLPKDHPVEAGGRRVLARECRRRLGKRLGWEVASLLVPESRGEPYRLRTPEEHERLGRLRLRIVGRAGVRLTHWSDVDRVPEE